MKTFFFPVIVLMIFSCTSNNNKGKPIPTKNDSATVNAEDSHVSKTTGKCENENQVASLGIGVVIPPPQFAMYDDSLLTDNPVLIDMYKQYDSLAGYCTLVFDPEYGLMHFACIGNTAKAYQVLINYSQVKYLPKKKGYEFQSWEQYIVRSFGVTRKAIKKGEDYIHIGSVRKEPDDKADTIAMPPGHEMFCAMKVADDWMKVQYDCFYNQESNRYEGQPCHNFIHKCKDPLTGWLRWRQGNKLLVDIYLMP